MASTLSRLDLRALKQQEQGRSSRSQAQLFASSSPAQLSDELNQFLKTIPVDDLADVDFGEYEATDGTVIWRALATYRVWIDQETE